MKDERENRNYREHRNSTEDNRHHNERIPRDNFRRENEKDNREKYEFESRDDRRRINDRDDNKNENQIHDNRKVNDRDSRDNYRRDNNRSNREMRSNDRRDINDPRDNYRKDNRDNRHTDRNQDNNSRRSDEGSRNPRDRRSNESRNLDGNRNRDERPRYDNRANNFRPNNRNSNRDDRDRNDNRPNFRNNDDNFDNRRGYEKNDNVNRRNSSRSPMRDGRGRGGHSGRGGRRNNRSGSREDNSKFEWGKKSDNVEEEEQPVEKEKPNFGLSGKLTEDTNKVNGVVIKYAEPPESRKPKRRWRLYPFKGEQSLQTLYIHRQSCYLIGRDRKICDLPVDHPSCSKQHAALQYRLVPFKRDDGSTGKRVRPYIIDLESANNTFVNNQAIEPRKYVELLEKDVIKFGFSSREYVLLHENSKEDQLDDDVLIEEESHPNDNKVKIEKD